MNLKLRWNRLKSKNLASAAGLIVLICIVNLGCHNVFSDLANKTTDDALFYQAQQQINASNYDGAVSTIQTMSNGGQAARSTRDLLASAYAGSCGLNLLGLSTALSSLGNNTLFQSLLTQYQSGVALQVTKCGSAESVLKALSNRTPDESLLLAFTELVKIGRQLSIVADLNHDGFADATFDSCAMSDADATIVGTGVTTFLLAITTSNLPIASGVTATLNTTCTTIDQALAIASPGYSGFCTKTTFTSTELKAFKSLIRSNELGLKTCQAGSGDFMSCICP